MKSKVTKRKKVNVFADGGGTIIQNITDYKNGNLAAGQAAAGQGLGVLNGVVNLTGQAINNLKTDSYHTLDFNAGSFDSLLAQAQSYVPEKAHTQSVAGNALSGAMLGALAGMAFGPWGAAIGGVAGGLATGLTTLFGNKKEENAANKARMKSIINMNTNALSISNLNGLNDQMDYFAEGGDLGNGVTVFNTGGTHEENPNGGIPQGIGSNGQPNLVEQGEVKYKDYIFSNRLKANKTILGQVGLPTKYIGKTYGEIAKNLEKESAERPNDPISQRGLADMMQRLKDALESTKAIKEARIKQNQQLELQQYALEQLGQEQPQEMAYGGNIYSGLEGFSSQMTIPWNTKQPDLNFNMTIPNQMFPMAKSNPLITADDFLDFGSKLNYFPPSISSKDVIDTSAPVEKSKKGNNLLGVFNNIDESYLRYAPIVASGLLTLSDAAGWTNKADTTLADTISNQAPRATRLTDKINYQPLDTRFIQNQANAQLAATRQSIIDLAGGNRGAAMAGLIGADYSGNLQAGLLAIQAAQTNLAQKELVAQFNRLTNQYNADADKWEQLVRSSNIIQGAQAKENAIQLAASVRSNNMNNFLNNVTGLGLETMNRNMITSNPALYYTIDNTGKVKYKATDIAAYAKANNMSLAEAKKIIDAHATSNLNFKS